MKVVIIEDEWVVSEELKELLKVMGHHVIAQFDNVEEALSRMETLSPDVIFLDLRLKGVLTGIDFLKRLSNENMYIVPITACYENQFTRDFKNYGIEFYLRKPFREFQLRSVFEGFKNPKSNRRNPERLLDRYLSKAQFLIEKFMLNKIVDTYAYR